MMAASTPDSDKEDEDTCSTNDDGCTEEQQIFWAAQLLAGNLTLENQNELVGEAILNVLLVPSDPEEDRPTKRIKTSSCIPAAESPVPCWSMEVTRVRVEDFQRSLEALPINDQSTSQSWCALMACWLNDSSCPNNNSETTTTIVSSKERQPNLTRLPFYSLFRNAIISMAHLHLANEYMEQSLDAQGNLSCALATTTTTTSSGSNHSSREESMRPVPAPAQQQQQQHIIWALHYWPTNPSALLWAANWERMKGTAFWPRALQLYRAAIKCAHITVTQLAQPVLRLDTTNDSNNKNADSVSSLDNTGLSSDDKFLVETVLCQSTQQQDNDDDDDDVSENEDENENNDMGESQVLVTAAYMSALLASCLGQHDVAASSLHHFASPQHPVTRIHPRVWDTGCQLQGKAVVQQSPVPSQSAAASSSRGIPCVFPDAISRDLFQVLRHAFRVDAPYWKESGYSRNVYYSFWTDYPLPRPVNNNEGPNDSSCIVGNAVEHYIVAHLLPRVQSVVNFTKDQQVRGFEWWVHTRPHGANIGHQLHFDTDEALLEQDGIVEFPIAATVTYLTLEDTGVPQHGATVLFDQTPYTKTNAETAYVSFPKSRSLLVFPGNLLHGVLPCSSTSSTDAVDDSGGDNSSLSRQTTEHHQRLTFMVNFWGYRIPDRIHNRCLYGPSGPLPPPSPEHTWVHDICRGYPQTIPLPFHTPITAPSNNSGLVVVSPAWDTLEDSSTGSSVQHHFDEWSLTLDSPLTMPSSSGIQQRFFVTDAPDYFHSTLMEK